MIFMPKVDAAEITAADINEFVRTYSDFAFEISILKTVSDLGLRTWHAGTYEDPVTNKARQFDIQAIGVSRGPAKVETVLRFAIECKNFRANYPLLVHCLPRTDNEAFVDAIWSAKDTGPNAMIAPRYGSRVRMAGENSPYRIGEPVGKSCDQVGKRPGGELFGNDQDVFDKIAQALNSAYQLLRDAHYAGLRESSLVTSVVVPILVVPAGRLWGVEYDDVGSVIKGPAQASHISYFVDRTFIVTGSRLEGQTAYTFSHLHICEASALADLIDAFLDDPRLTLKTVADTHMSRFPGPRSGGL